MVDFEAIARDSGYQTVAPLNVSTLQFLPEVREMCSADRCRSYGKSWACPPACGTLEECAQRAAGYRKGLLLQTIWQIDDVMDGKQIKPAKETHNRLQRQLRKKLEAIHPGGFLIGASGCDFCKRCSFLDGQPCRFPENMASCMSAYCIFVRELCDRTGLEYDLGNGLVAFFGMYVFDKG